MGSYLTEHLPDSEREAAFLDCLTNCRRVSLDLVESKNWAPKLIPCQMILLSLTGLGPRIASPQKDVCGHGASGTRADEQLTVPSYVVWYQAGESCRRPSQHRP